MPVVPALVRWRQEDYEFDNSLGYTVSPWLRNPEPGVRMLLGHT